MSPCEEMLSRCAPLFPCESMLHINPHVILKGMRRTLEYTPIVSDTAHWLLSGCCVYSKDSEHLIHFVIFNAEYNTYMFSLKPLYNNTILLYIDDEVIRFRYQKQ